MKLKKGNRGYVVFLFVVFRSLLTLKHRVSYCKRLGMSLLLHIQPLSLKLLSISTLKVFRYFFSKLLNMLNLWNTF